MVSLSLVPMLASRFLAPHPEDRSGRGSWIQKLASVAEAFFNGLNYIDIGCSNHAHIGFDHLGRSNLNELPSFKHT